MSQKTLLLTHDDLVKATCTAPGSPRGKRIYPVLRGGFPIASILALCSGCTIVNDPLQAEVIVDDVIASGATRDKYAKIAPGIPFFAPYNVDNTDYWLVFPYEKDKEDDYTDLMTRVLQMHGKEPTPHNLEVISAAIVEAIKGLE